MSSVADEIGCPESNVILGGDHLGPWVWQGEPAGRMAKARKLVRSCVLAGYTKIHLDASMRCADDQGDRALASTSGSPLTGRSSSAARRRRLTPSSPRALRLLST